MFAIQSGREGAIAVQPSTSRRKISNLLARRASIRLCAFSGFPASIHRDRNVDIAQALENARLDPPATKCKVQCGHRQHVMMRRMIADRPQAGRFAEAKPCVC